ncbi:arylsulfatase G-like [Glandiceps talaboti]
MHQNINIVTILFVTVVSLTTFTIILASKNEDTTVTTWKGDTRPNFIVMFADDIGWGDIGVNWNPDNSSNTPNIDALANSGVRFTDFHSGASVCTPSRAALLTSRLGLRTGVVRNFDIRSVGGLPLNETVFAETFKEAGYRTGMIGFDYYFGLPYSNDMGCVDKPGYNLPSCAACPKDTPLQSWDIDYSLCHPLSAIPLYENTKIIEQPTDLFTLSERYANKANEFVMNGSKSDQPFLLYVAFAHMHVPLAYDDKFTNSSKSGVYGDTLRELDDVVGKIVNSVKTAGKEDNTLVWFLGDNGPWAVKCEYAGSQGPFLGAWQHEQGGGGSSAKRSLWEAGHREPAFAYWPGRIPAGHVTDSLLSALDVFPTMASLAGVAMPTNRRYDGMDVTGVLFNKTEIHGRVLFHPNSGSSGIDGNLDGVRLGDYKAIYQTGGDEDCGGNISLPIRHDPPLIFNLASDPAERFPLNPKSEEYKTVHFGVQNALQSIMDDIKSDNTSVADYRLDPSQSGGPCCNPTHVACRCND